MTLSKPPFAPSDTSIAIASLQLRRYREMSVERKLELVEDANSTALALTGLATRHPGASESELHLRLFHLLHGRELATKVWGPLPEDTPG